MLFFFGIGARALSPIFVLIINYKYIYLITKDDKSVNNIIIVIFIIYKYIINAKN